MILPIYNHPITPDEITLCNGSIVLKCTKKFVKDIYEPTLIFIYECSTELSLITVMYNNITKQFDLKADAQV